MKILFFGNEKGLINKLADAINTFTTHQAVCHEKLKIEHIAPVYKKIRPIVTEQPDIEEVEDQSYWTQEDGEDPVFHQKSVITIRKQQPITTYEIFNTQSQSWETFEKPADIAQFDGIETPGYSRIVQSPMTDPDVVICIDNYVTWEDLERMVVTTKPTRCLYITGAPPKRGGTTRLDARYRDFNKLYFGQTEIDKDLFSYEAINPLTNGSETTRLYNDITFLPPPVMSDNVDILADNIRTDKLVVGMAQSSRVHAGAYTKGFHLLRPVHDVVGFDLDLIFNTNYSDCLQRKANCNLIWDSHMGNIGVSGLESMAQGLAVIGRFHPVMYENWERLSNGVAFPAIGWTDIADLQSKLQSYKNDPEQLVAIGQASRNWMTTYATSSKISNYWCDTLESKL